VILLRPIEKTQHDIEALERFSHVPGMFNLSSDPEVIQAKIQKSMLSFSGEIEDPIEAKYIFVAEDVESKKVLGTSMIAAQHGTPEAPHFYFQVGTEEKYSETINTGFIHGTLELKYDTDGPSELGGLVLDPDYRNSDARLGRQISFVRFMFLAIYRSLFRDQLIAELLPPLNKKGLSPLWEAIGRRFTNMDYWEADRLCVQNKDFIFSLFPEGKIYTTFLTAEARHAIGKVSAQTEPVAHMLKKIGFEYRAQVDPFDGGPHLWAQVDQLLPVRGLQKLKVRRVADDAKSTTKKVLGLMSRGGKPQEFFAIQIEAWVEGDELFFYQAGIPSDPRLVFLDGASVYWMPYY
jgi:arginine N-succinyltransferase